MDYNYESMKCYSRGISQNYMDGFMEGVRSICIDQSRKNDDYMTGYMHGLDERARRKWVNVVTDFIREYSGFDWKQLNEMPMYCDSFDFTFFIHNIPLRSAVIQPDTRHLFINVSSYSIDEELLAEALICAQEKVFSGVNVLELRFLQDAIALIEIDKPNTTHYFTKTVDT